ncbi:MAG TPA: hypothetical protein VEG08_06840, partial [Terriglobales bacterium]|nr:hypothetical protein [Terriglobales bacterium]
PGPTNASDQSPGGEWRRRRRGWGGRLLARLRGPWLLPAAGIILFGVLVGLMTVFLLDRL